MKDAESALQSYIRDLADKSNASYALLSTAHAGFRKSRHGRRLALGRNGRTQGRLLSDGVLIAEQANPRLKNADHRFVLQVRTTKAVTGFVSTFFVESVYDFEPFKTGHITHIPLTEAFVLKLPDGLSHHMTKIGIAQDFNYSSKWTVHWR